MQKTNKKNNGFNQKKIENNSIFHNDIDKIRNLAKDGYDLHFRIYFKSKHPALITGENKNDYEFHRVTTSEKSGHHTNYTIYPNPDKKKETPMHILRRKENDNKGRFTTYKLDWQLPENNPKNKKVPRRSRANKFTQAK